MEDQAVVFVEGLFKKYRTNFDNLESLFIKKGIELPSVSQSIKVKGEVFHSQVIAKEKWDFTMHTCGLSSYPEELGVQGQSNYLLQDYEFLPTQ